MASTEIRERRRILRYRRLVLRQAVQMKNRVAGLLMETGVSYNKLRLHRMGYFEQLLSTNEEISDSIRPLLKHCCEHINRSIRLDTAKWGQVATIKEAVGSLPKGLPMGRFMRFRHESGRVLPLVPRGNFEEAQSHQLAEEALRKNREK